MGRRIRALILIAALVGVGVLAGSALSQRWELPGTTVAANTVRGAAVPAEPAPLPRGRVRVEVLNAGGRSNLARAATDALREVGFDVVYFGNADSFDRESSVVLDRVGGIESARAVADVLGIRSVRSEPDSNLFVDVSVLLGGDWDQPPPPAPPVVEARPWWDLRRFLPEPEPSAPAGGTPSGTMANPTGSGEGDL